MTDYRPEALRAWPAWPHRDPDGWWSWRKCNGDYLRGERPEGFACLLGFGCPIHAPVEATP